MLDHSQIQVLIAVDNSSTLSEAAILLNITQSAISQNLKTIESKLGIPIVVKQGKKNVLTNEAKKIIKIGKVYTKKIEELLTELHTEAGSIVGDLNIGTLFGLGKSWVGNKSIEYSKLHPNLSINLQMDYPFNLLQAFESHDLDILILPQNLAPSFGESTELHEEKMTLIFPKKWEKEITEKSTLKEIVKFPIIFFENMDPLFYNWCKTRFNQTPRNIRPCITVNAFGQIISAVSKGIGLAVVPYHVYRRSHLRKEIATLGKDYNLYSSNIEFISHIENKNHLKVKDYYQFLKNESKQIHTDED
jgi:DNA-binding transcriptional LysR family regulator